MKTRFRNIVLAAVAILLMAGAFNALHQPAAVSAANSSSLTDIKFSKAPVFDFAAGRTARMVLTGDVESSIVANAPIGEPLVLLIVQDHAGAHRFTWPAGLGSNSNGGVFPDPLAITSQAFVFDGRRLIPIGPLTGVPGR